MNEKQRQLFERIKGTPHLLACDVLRKDFIDLVDLIEKLDSKLNEYEGLVSIAKKTDKLHLDLLQMGTIGGLEEVKIDYVLSCIENDKY